MLRGLDALRVPRAFTLIAAFMYRYLFVIAEEAQRHADGAELRGRTPRGTPCRPLRSDVPRRRCSCAPTVAASASTRRCSRAASRARCPTLEPLRFRAADTAFVVVIAVLLVGVRLAIGAARVSCAIHARGLTYAYPDGTLALDDVTLHVAARRAGRRARAPTAPARRR